MSRLVFDIECDGLLTDCTRMWIFIAYDLDTKKFYEFKENDFGWIDLLNNANKIIGHNILGYDIYVLKKLFDYELPDNVEVHDTLIFSEVLDYRRFGHKGHSLEAWGEHLGYPKIGHEDWSQYSEEMYERCKQDVKINVLTYKELTEEFATKIEKSPLIKTYIKAEHYAARWAAESELYGWLFDIKGAYNLYERLERDMNKAHKALDSKLGIKAVAVDKKKGIVEIKEPRWTKVGFYNRHIADWFGIDPCSGYEGEERPIVGPYCRVIFEPLKLDSSHDVKLFLYRNGWEPTEWNYRKNKDGELRKTSPKITEDSLEFLGKDGKLYTEFLSAKSRYGILKTWLENVDEDDKLHGKCKVIGTPSMRATHSIIVNVPSVDAPYGKEMRELFKCPKGWKIIGCDSASNQARGLAHFLGDTDYIETLINGDIHSYNAEVLTNVLRSMNYDYKVPRANAKRILYAFLFGASGKKLWSYIFGSQQVKLGNKLKKGFLKAVPGFEELLKKLENIFGSTKKYGYGYIPSLCGNRIYVDSFHKLLVYLLQSTEKITCSTAIMLTMENLKSANIPYQPLIYMHDEIQFMVPEEYAEQAAKIGKEAFKEGPKLYNVTIMDGDSQIGDSWYETH